MTEIGALARKCLPLKEAHPLQRVGFARRHTFLGRRARDVALACLLFAGVAPCICSAEVKSGRVAMYDGRPTIFVNDRPAAPMIYALPAGGRRTWETTPHRNLENFARQEVDLYQIDVGLKNVWLPDGTLDMDQVGRQIRGVLEVRPSAAVFIRLRVDPPTWWMEKHLGERHRICRRPGRHFQRRFG